MEITKPHTEKIPGPQNHDVGAALLKKDNMPPKKNTGINTKNKCEKYIKIIFNRGSEFFWRPRKIAHVNTNMPMSAF